MESLTKHYKAKCSEETTSQLRESLTNSIEEVENLVYKEKQEREGSISYLQQQINELKQHLEDHKAKMQDEKLEYFQKAQQGLVETFVKEEKELKRVEFESRRFLNHEIRMQKEPHILSEPRQFSIS